MWFDPVKETFEVSLWGGGGGGGGIFFVVHTCILDMKDFL